MMLRRQFLFTGVTAAVLRGASLGPKERIDRAIRGGDLDRPPFTFWHHFGLNNPEDHAKATLAFHQKYRTDLVKVMSDFPYPRPSGKWYELKPESNPFAPQIRVLESIRKGLDGRKYFIETVFNPWNVAEKLSSPGAEAAQRAATGLARRARHHYAVGNQSREASARRWGGRHPSVGCECQIQRAFARGLPAIQRAVR